MTTFENRMTFILSEKGVPASVLLALFRTRHPMTRQELQRWTGCDEDAIMLAISTLLDMGWISDSSDRGGPWSIAPGRQLPAGAQGQPDENPDPGQAGLIALPESSAGNPVAPGRVDDDREDPRFVNNLYALYDAGVREPTAGRLAGLPHVNPEYIVAHINAANAQGFTLGTAIHRIEHAWPIPHTKQSLSVDDKISRFMSQQWHSNGSTIWDDENFDRPNDPTFDSEKCHD
jgi:hypothetical protein